MPDLPAIAGDPRQRLAADDEPAADSHLARYEQDLVHADGRATALFGECPEIGVVGDPHRDVDVERLDEPLAKRDVSPAEIGCHPDETVAPPNNADDGDADPYQRLSGRLAGADEPR